MPERSPKKPSVLKNSFYWFAAILVVAAGFGLVGGDELIRDPGQKRETINLGLLYAVGAVVMFANGWISHRQAVQGYEESLED